MSEKVKMLSGMMYDASTDAQLIDEQPFHCDYGYKISVGNNFYANFK